MPPLEPLDPPEGDIAPYPNEILTLSGKRWLSPSGRVLTEPAGNPCDIQENTRWYWEDCAVRAGYTLDELLP